MECNKEEALRAMDIAEKRMEKKDFEGAKKIAEKALRLHSDLPNVSQMILVCDVHCASQSKLSGNELDWYGVLQIQQAADEVAIKKQYRKLALSLHPDKNNFPGAADAFKMIGEASKVLTDKGKRSIYDNKCKAAGKFQAPARTQNATRQTNGRGHPWFQSSFPNNGSASQQPPPPPQPKTQPVDLNNRPKFWTVCPYCKTRYQYYRDLLNRNLTCQKCKKEYAAFEMSAPENPQTGSKQPVFPQPTAAKKDNSATRRKGNANIKIPNRGPIPEKKGNLGAGSSKRSRKKRSHSEDIIHSEDSDSSSDMSGGDLPSQKFGLSSDQNLRRSARSKQQVSYNYGKDASDDEMSESDETELMQNTGDKEEPAGTAENDRDAKRKKVSSTDEVSRNGISTGAEKAQAPEDDDEPREVEYPEPDFNNFDREREEKSFAAGQMWAIYDTLDAMPRFYAIVRKVLSPSFSLRITWFEANPDAVDEAKWVKEGLPAACGKFSIGSTEVTDVLGMFSHRVNMERGGRKDKYKMYPRKGETWAIFKEWDMNWHSDPQRKKEFEYEFVEVLSEYDEDRGTQVAYLGKLKGFSCLFCRIVKDGVGFFEIPAKDLFRFSHKVPSFQMTGNERPEVPTGSFELDPGSLPRNLPEIDVLTASSMGPGKMPQPFPKPDEDSRKPMDDKAREAATAKYVDDLFSESSRIRDLYEDGEEMEDDEPVNQTVPETEFYNFDADKAMEKYQVNQVWAVYGDEDALPKYYGKIRKIDPPPNFAVHLTWLESLPPPKSIIPWTDRRMHAGCGDFRLQPGKPQMFAGTDPFSHQVKAVEDKNIFRIYPQRGEIWALYKDWKPSIAYSDLDSCEYEPAEVLFASELETTVLFLEAIPDHKSVFKPRVKGKSNDIKQIPQSNLLQFSHQIPAFQLTTEGNCTLRGLWELDSAALPAHFYSSKAA